MNVLLFDGICNLCNGFVNTLIKIDQKKILKFAAIQTDSGQKLLADHGLKTDTDSLNTVFYIKDNKAYIRSSACLHALIDIGGFYKIAFALLIIPAPIRDLFYKCIAKYRYRLFGQKETCMIPTPVITDRFL